MHRHFMHVVGLEFEVFSIHLTSPLALQTSPLICIMRLQLFHGYARRLQKCVNIMQFIYMVHMYAACRVQTRTDRDSTREWEREGDKWTVCDTGALNTTASNSYSYEKCHTKRTFTLSNWVGCSPICLPYVLSLPLPLFAIMGRESFGRVADCPLGALVCPLTVRCRLQEPVDVAAWHAL